MPKPIPQEAFPVIDGKSFGHIATVMPDGTPQSTPVWIDRDGDVLTFNTAKGRAKHRNLERDPKVAVSVLDPENPYVYLQVRGQAEIVEDENNAHINKMAKKYMDKDEYPFLQDGEERVIVRVNADAVTWYTGR